MAKAIHKLAGLKLTTGSCPECGKPVAVKANKNGTAYFYCGNPDIQYGGICNHQTRYSPKLSAKLCAAYLTSKGQQIHEEPANLNRPPIKLVAEPSRARTGEPEPAAEPETNFFGL